MTSKITAISKHFGAFFASYGIIVAVVIGFLVAISIFLGQILSR